MIALLFLMVTSVLGAPTGYFNASSAQTLVVLSGPASRLSTYTTVVTLTTCKDEFPGCTLVDNSPWIVTLTVISCPGTTPAVTLMGPTHTPNGSKSSSIRGLVDRVSQSPILSLSESPSASPTNTASLRTLRSVSLSTAAPPAPLKIASSPLATPPMTTPALYATPTVDREVVFTLTAYRTWVICAKRTCTRPLRISTTSPPPVATAPLPSTTPFPLTSKSHTTTSCVATP